MLGAIRSEEASDPQRTPLSVALRPVYEALARAEREPLRAESHLLRARASLTEAINAVAVLTEA